MEYFNDYEPTGYPQDNEADIYAVWGQENDEQPINHLNK